MLKSCANRAVGRADDPKEFHASLAAWNGSWRRQSAAAAWRAPPLLWIRWILQPWPPPRARRLDGETAALACKIAEQSASDSLCNLYCTTCRSSMARQGLV